MRYKRGYDTDRALLHTDTVRVRVRIRDSISLHCMRDIRDCRVHGLGVTLPLHGRYKAVTLRSCNVDPCIRTRISRGFQNCAQIDLNQHARKTIRQKPPCRVVHTCRVPASTLQNSWRYSPLIRFETPIWHHSTNNFSSTSILVNLRPDSESS